MIVNSAWTPPSACRPRFVTKRASRTGPLPRGTTATASVPPLRFANATCGFTAGLEPANRRLRVAPAAAIEVHAWSQAFVDFLRLVEVDLAGVEVFELLRGQPGEWCAGCRRTGAHAWIRGFDCAHGLRCHSNLKDQQARHRDRRYQRKRLAFWREPFPDRSSPSHVAPHVMWSLDECVQTAGQRGKVVAATVDTVTTSGFWMRDFSQARVVRLLN